MAPPMAADALGRVRFTMDELVRGAGLAGAPGVDVGLVETRGRGALAADP